MPCLEIVGGRPRARVSFPFLVFFLMVCVAVLHLSH